ncbi:hypothetical protein COBT_000608 [Conglomerata obtusa]
MKMSICKFKIEEMIKAQIYTDDVILQIWEFSDYFYKTIFLEFFLNKKKRISESTAKKQLKIKIEKIIGASNEFNKLWATKLSYYKKKKFFETYEHILKEKTAFESTQ